MESRMNLNPGEVFNNRYKLIKILGMGGFAEVWLAEDIITHVQNAIKIYTSLDDNAFQELLQEYSRMHGIIHPNLLHADYFDRFLFTPYLIMRYCSGGSLIQKIGNLTPDEATDLIHDMGAGLACLHKNEIVHLDIKPANVLIDIAADGKPSYQLTDFGISAKTRNTLRKSINAGVETVTMTESYAPPEKFSGSRKERTPSPKNDIFSFGITLYELLTGTLPIKGKATGREMYYNQFEIDYSLIEDQALRIFVQMCTRLNPEDRPDAESFDSILREIRTTTKEVPLNELGVDPNAEVESESGEDETEAEAPAAPAVPKVPPVIPPTDTKAPADDDRTMAVISDLPDEKPEKKPEVKPAEKPAVKPVEKPAVKASQPQPAKPVKKREEAKTQLPQDISQRSADPEDIKKTRRVSLDPNKVQGAYGPNSGKYGPNSGQYGPNSGQYGPNSGQYGPNSGSYPGPYSGNIQVVRGSKGGFLSGLPTWVTATIVSVVVFFVIGTLAFIFFRPKAPKPRPIPNQGTEVVVDKDLASQFITFDVTGIDSEFVNRLGMALALTDEIREISKSDVTFEEMTDEQKASIKNFTNLYNALKNAEINYDSYPPEDASGQFVKNPTVSSKIRSIGTVHDAIKKQYEANWYEIIK